MRKILAMLLSVMLLLTAAVAETSAPLRAGDGTAPRGEQSPVPRLCARRDFLKRGRY